MAGFGDVFLTHLTTVPSATADELASLAGVTFQQAISRLNFMERVEKRLTGVGKGKKKLWSIPEGQSPVFKKRAAKIVEVDKSLNGADRCYGWKPSTERFSPVTIVPKVGDKLLVVYPERWRHSLVASVTRVPDVDGASLCWDLRGKMYAYVPVDPAVAARHGVALFRVVKSRDLKELIGEDVDVEG